MQVCGQNNARETTYIISLSCPRPGSPITLISFLQLPIKIDTADIIRHIQYLHLKKYTLWLRRISTMDRR